jgi:hypothetical protein
MRLYRPLGDALPIVQPHGRLDGTNAPHDSVLLPAQTGDKAKGSVMLVRSGAATARHLLVNVVESSPPAIDTGLLGAGPLWRPAQGNASGVHEGHLILDQRDRNPLTGAEFVVPARQIRPLQPSHCRRCPARGDGRAPRRRAAARPGAGRALDPGDGRRAGGEKPPRDLGAFNQKAEDPVEARGSFPLPNQILRIAEPLKGEIRPPLE